MLLHGANARILVNSRLCAYSSEQADLAGQFLDASFDGKFWPVQALERRKR
jgi:hypothetical protein